MWIPGAPKCAHSHQCRIGRATIGDEVGYGANRDGGSQHIGNISWWILYNSRNQCINHSPNHVGGS